jgi:hypothetical protein
MVLPPMMPNDTIPPLLDRIASVTSTCVPQPWQYHSTLQAGLRPAPPAPCRGATGKLRPHSIARLRWSTRACLHGALEFHGEVRNGADHRWPLLPQRLHGPLAILGQPNLRQTNKQTTAAAVRHTQRPAPRLDAAPAAAAGDEQLCLLRVRVRVATSKYSAVVRVGVRVRAGVCARCSGGGGPDSSAHTEKPSLRSVAARAARSWRRRSPRARASQTGTAQPAVHDTAPTAPAV